MKQPPKWKFAIAVWIAIYPAIVTLQFVLGNILKNMNIPLRSLLMTLILVPLMVYILLPLVRKLLGNWLNQ